MEVYKPKMDESGNILRDYANRMAPGDLAAIAVMEKRAGWGAAYSDELRNGDWDYGLFSAAGEIKNNDATACLACHRPYGDSSYMHSFAELVAKASE